ncbi:MAG: FAD-binding oxidoreductase [Roseiarcus sp.]
MAQVNSLVSEDAARAALREFEAVVGSEWVRTIEEALAAYGDEFAPGTGDQHAIRAVVAPSSTEEVQAILRTAAAHRVPLWPVSRGKNLGYGGSAPLVSGSVVLDLSRMNRILDVDEKLGLAVVEPGVSFFDLYEHLQRHRIRLWLSAPGHGLGSLIGNALERGFGFTPYGDHTSKLCGLEVVLPDGELARTGMGAMRECRAWHHYPYSFGPHWDQMFVQSNLGVVTRAGIWLMPEPEMTITLHINLPKFEDIAWFVDEMAQLRIREVFQQPLICGNYLRPATVFSRRSEWWRGPGPIPESVARQMMQRYRTGWWTADLSLFGYDNVVRAQADIVRRAIEPRLRQPLQFRIWRRGEPIERSPAGIPTQLSLETANWRGLRGATIGFSPVMPAVGRLVLEHARRLRARHDEFGIDYYASFAIGSRHITNINLIIFDRDDPVMTKAARDLFQAAIEDAAREGYGEYRTHIDFMQAVSDTFDFNDHALRRLNERVKDALDPAGVLAPGKNGVWPASYRSGEPEA